MFVCSLLKRTTRCMVDTQKSVAIAYACYWRLWQSMFALLVRHITSPSFLIPLFLGKQRRHCTDHNHIATRPSVHHGGHPSGCKLYLLQIIEEQNQGQDDHGQPKNLQQDEALGTWVKTSPFGQWVFSKIQRMHCKERDDSQVSPPGLLPLQHHQTGYGVQKPFRLHPQRSQQ